MKRVVPLFLVAAFAAPAVPAHATYCDRLPVNVSCEGPTRHCDAYVRGDVLLGTSSRCVVLDDIVHS